MVKIKIDNEPYCSPNGKNYWDTLRGAKISFSRIHGKEKKIKFRKFW